MKQGAITTAPIQYFPLDALYLSDMNPRQDVDADRIDQLADSIVAVGLLQNLAGLADEAGHVGIVAGGRRLRALIRAFEKHADLLDRRPELAEIPVRLAPDEATARAWASVENAAREDLHPADEIRAYGRMAETGSDVPAIARVFAVTEAHVYRRLALAALPVPILDALKAGEITLEAAKCFTVAQDEALALDTLIRVRGQDVSAHHLKQLLQPEAIRHTDRRAIYVGLDAYEGEGGPITRDLFANEVFLGDGALLDQLFAEKLAMDAEAIGHGWKWVETSPESWISYDVTSKLDRIYRVEGDLTEEQAERYDELSELAEAEALGEEGQAELDALDTLARGDFTDAQRDHAGLFVFVDSRGELIVQAAYIRAEDREAAIAAEILTGHAARSRDGSAVDAAPKSPISNAQRDDLGRVAQGARQNAALRDPELLIDLLAYQLSHGLAWRKPFGLATEDVPNWPTTEAEGYALDDRLTANPPRDMYGKDLAKSFRAFRSKGAEHVRGELVRMLAAHYRGGSDELAALIDKETKPAIREVWTPTAANFFSRVGSPYLNDLWCDLLDLAADHPTATSFAKLKKGEKAAKLETLFSDADTRKALGITEAQEARIAAWLPEGMA